MDTRADFQRLLEDMDKVIQSKRQELSELDERLESARNQLSEREAEELRKSEDINFVEGNREANDSSQSTEAYIQEQKEAYGQQLAQFSEELNELEMINQELVKENMSLKQNLSATKKGAEKFRAKVMVLSETLEEVKSANLELNLRLARAESESMLQQKLLKKSHDQDEILLNAFNDKLDSMKSAIESKDLEITKLRMENQFILETLGITLKGGSNSTFNRSFSQSEFEVQLQMDTKLIDSNNKQKIIEIASAFREKDAQIELLKNQLLQATRDLENNATVLEALTKSCQIDGIEIDSSLLAYDRKLTDNELVKKCEMLESELELKDKQLHLVEFRNRHFETLFPKMMIDLMSSLTRSELTTNQETISKIESLTQTINRLLEEMSSAQNLLNTIDQLKMITESKDAHIEELVNDLNQLNAKYGHVQQDDIPKPLSSGEPLPLVSGEAIATDESKVLNNSASSDHKSELQDSLDSNAGGGSKREPQQQIQTQPIPIDSNENTPLTNRSKSLVASKSEGGIDFQSEEVDGGEGKRSIRRVSAKTKSSLKTMTSRSSRSILGRARQTATSIDSHKLGAQDRLRQLESENKLLELAMKEILLSIKWSDAKCSTILIDCPSLERLCQMIEAKFISKSAPTPKMDGLGSNTLDRPSSRLQEINNDDLFQIIVLKSELDLVRGQNEQLRADIKNHRNDHQKLLIDSHIMSSQASGQNVNQSIVNNSCLINESDNKGTRVLDTGCQTELEARFAITRCQNCQRLAEFTHRLLQCVARIEAQVNSSDQTYMNQLVGLYKLNRRLEKELNICESFLSEARRRYHEVRKQKLSTDSRLEMIENQMTTHSKICPLSQISEGEVSNLSADLQVYTAARNGKGDSIQSLMIRKKSQQQQQIGTPSRSSRMTITLLQSIINCLQARLDYKDERIQQMETILAHCKPIQTHKTNPLDQQQLVTIK